MGRVALVVLPFWVLAVLLLRPASAEEISGEILELREVVVTGTRTEKPVLETPVRTEVVSRREIEKTHARDLKEALEDVPGLVIKPIHGKSGFEAWLQGLDSDRVLIVIDGEPVTPSTGSSVDLSQIGTSSIERIEIVKGATSALYGSSAMGGVINVITRRPKRAWNYQLTLDGGSWGDKNLGGESGDIAARHLSANLSVKRPVWFVQSNVDLRDTDGYTLDPGTFRSEGAEGGKANVDLRFGWTPDDRTEIRLSPRYYREDISNNFSTFAPGVGDIEKRKNEDARRIHTTMSLERALDGGARLSGWLVQDAWRDITQQDVIATPEVDQQRNAEITLYRAELQWDRPWAENHLFTSGLVLGRETLDQTQDRTGSARAVEVDGEERRNIEAYLQDDIFFGERWEIVPGIRVQDDSGFGFYAAPKVNVLYTPALFSGITTNVRMGIGRGYRVPNLKERFYVFDHSQLGYMVLGNEDLEPERSDSYQLGVELVRPGDYRAELQLFHNRIRNLIDTDFNPDKSAQTGLLIFDYQNFARAITRGAELSGNIRLNRFQVTGAYTLLDSEDLDTGKTLKERPRHQVKLGIDYEHEAWGTTLGLRGVYESESFIDAANQQESPAWTTWDVNLTQRLTRALSFITGIDNLTDEYRDPGLSSDFRPAAGRFIYLGVRLDG